MNIVFVNPPTDSQYPKPPLGLLQVATACQDAGHKVRILDADLLKLTCNEILQDVADADIVGLTAMTPTYRTTSKIACMIKGETGVRTMIGGVHASIFPEALRDTGLYDIVVTGEGESATEAVALSGIYRSPDLTYDYIPTPDYSLIDVAAYKPRYPHGARLPWTAVHTSRGCPFQCTFCSKGVFGSKYRGMPAVRIYGLLRTLVEEHSVRDITFYDDEFTLDKQRLWELNNMLITDINHLGLTWTCEGRVAPVDMEQAILMKAAGCRLVYLGLESGNQDILNTLKKNTTLDQARRAVDIYHKVGIQVAAYFMLGAPGETMQSIQDTLDFSEELGLNHAQFSICTPLPGSELYKEFGNPCSGQYLGNGAKPSMVPDDIAARVIEAVEEGNRRWAK